MNIKELNEYIGPTIEKMQSEIGIAHRRITDIEDQLERLEESAIVFKVKGKTYRVHGDAKSLHRLSERFCRLEYLEKTYEPEK